MDAGNIVFATGGYDHSIKFWYPHDGVCYRTAQHPESVSPKVFPFNAHHNNWMAFFFFKQQVNKLEVTPDKRFVAAAGMWHENKGRKRDKIYQDPMYIFSKLSISENKDVCGQFFRSFSSEFIPIAVGISNFETFSTCM